MNQENKLNKNIIYQNLRTELNDTFKRIDNYYLTSFTVSASIWAFAIHDKKEWAALLPILILIPISLRTRNLRYGTTLISAFISVHLEDKIDYGWETMREKYYEKNPPSFLQNLSDSISRMSFSILTLSSSLVFWLIRYPNFKIHNTYYLTATLITFQLLTTVFQALIWKTYSHTSTIKKPLVENWKQLYSKQVKIKQSYYFKCKNKRNTRDKVE